MEQIPGNLTEKEEIIEEISKLPLKYAAMLQYLKDGVGWDKEKMTYVETYVLKQVLRDLKQMERNREAWEK